MQKGGFEFEPSFFLSASIKIYFDTAPLAEINLSDEMKVDFINEVNNAYIYNLAISNELEAKLK